jgi:hypothetical protein
VPWSSPVPVKRPGSFSAPIQQLAKPVPVLPPVSVNQVDPLAQMDPRDAIFMYNMLSFRYGTKVRQGYKQWATTVGPGGVKTVIPYAGSTLLKDRLFAIGTDGIYNVSASVATPAVSLAFAGGVSTNSGQGIWQAVTTLAGFFSAYCDEDKGYHLYTESTDSWAAVTGAQVTGVDPATFCFVMAYKERLWFIQKGTSSAWYLPVGAIIGAATQFNFGNKFKHGGTLQALYLWTIQGSTGPQNYLVAISSSGEILIYGGNDPSDAANFSIVGSWYIGNVPVGRRIAGNIGGDLYILSIAGLQPLNKIVQGNQTQIENIEVSRKISPAIRAAMLVSFQQNGWEVKLYPSQDALFVVSPQQTGFPATQFVQSLNNQGWSVYQSMPIFTGDVWEGNFYFGGLDGNVYIIQGDTDNQPRTGVSAGNNIVSSCLGSFQDYGEPGLYHIPEYIRPVFLSAANPAASVSVRFDYNISEVLLPGTAAPSVGSLWDIAIWDVNIWGGAVFEVEAVAGAGGMGRAMAIGLQMSTSAETTLIRYDLMFTSGGML